MNNYKDVLTTTSNTIDGAQIKQYFGIVSAHVVAGTNVFSDIAAGFSDFFGGRSVTYANHISKIKAQALTDLKYEALELGANAVISISIDVDEVSGGGKSMFMITAYGTAVALNKVHFENQGKVEASIVTGNVIADIIEKKMFVEQYKTHPLSMSDDEWSRLLELKIPEVGNFVEWEELDCGFKEERLSAYLASIEIEDSISHGYRLFEKAQSKIDISTIQKVLEKLSLTDYVKSIALLKSKSDSLPHKKTVLKTIIKPKRIYSKDDLVTIDELIKVIEVSFPPVAVHKTKKGLLGKEKALWECSVCGQRENDESLFFCKSCGGDKQGFKPEEINPAKAIKNLLMIKETLNELLLSK